MNLAAIVDVQGSSGWARQLLEGWCIAYTIIVRSVVTKTSSCASHNHAFTTLSLYSIWPSYHVFQLAAPSLHVAITGRVDCTSWGVDNKYYEATLEFEICSLEKELSKDYQAVIILHDFHQVSSVVRSSGVYTSLTSSLLVNDTAQMRPPASLALICQLFVIHESWSFLLPLSS